MLNSHKQNDESHFGMNVANMTKGYTGAIYLKNKAERDFNTSVMGFISSDKKERTEVIQGDKIKQLVVDNLNKEAIIITDSHLSYVGLSIWLF